MTPESTNDGMMKKTVMKTDCAVVFASTETRTPMASEASTNGSVTQKSASQLPCGQMPKTRPLESTAKRRSPYETPTYGTSFPSTICSEVVGSASICS